MSKSYNKQDFVNQLSADNGLSKKQCGEIYDSLFNQIEVALKDGKEVILPFGKIGLAHVKDAKKRNVYANEEVDVPAHTKPTFKFFKLLKDAVKDLPLTDLE